MNRLLVFGMAAALAVGTGMCDASAQSQTITNDTFWKTTDGKFIFSQGGGIFKFPDPKTGDERYYWYGVHYQEADTYAANPVKAGKNNVTNFASVTCYVSDDLVNWTFVSDVLTPASFAGHDYPGWLGRLGVAYIPEKQKYALLVQYNSSVLIALSDSPTGSFKYHQAIDMTSRIGTPNTGDQTVFTDDDGQSYLVYSYGSGRSKIYVSKIGVENDKVTLLDVNQVYKGAGREGNCMFKYKGKYYICASDLYGWNASNVYYLEASHIYGPYTPTNNMEIMDGASADYGHVTQTGFFYTVKGSVEETVIYCGDRWACFAGNGDGFNQWCPITFVNNRPQFNSLTQWSLDVETGEWSVGAENNYVRNFSFEADRINIPSTNKPAQTYLKGWNFDVLKGNAIAQGVSSSPVLNAANTTTDRSVVMGNFCLNVTDNVAFSRKIYQKIESTASVKLPDGTYSLRVMCKSGGSFSNLRMYVKCGDQSADVQSSRSDEQWHQMVIDNFEIRGGEAEVGFLVEGLAKAWARFDDVWLVRTGDLADSQPTELNTIESQQQLRKTGVYTLDGKRVESLRKGLNIVTYVDSKGKTISKAVLR